MDSVRRRRSSESELRNAAGSSDGYGPRKWTRQQAKDSWKLKLGSHFIGRFTSCVETRRCFREQHWMTRSQLAPPHQGEELEDALEGDAELEHDGALALVLSHLRRGAVSPHGVHHLLHGDGELGDGPVEGVEQTVQELGQELGFCATGVHDEVLEDGAGALGVGGSNGAGEGQLALRRHRILTRLPFTWRIFGDSRRTR